MGVRRRPADAVEPSPYRTASHGVVRPGRPSHRPADLATASVAENVDGDPDLAWALAQLPADDVELARLWAWEQLEPREITLVLGISANTASARLSRLRRRLKELLESRHDPVSAGHNTGADQAERNR